MFVDEYNHRRPDRSLAHRSPPAVAYAARPDATPGGRDDTHHRVRVDIVDNSGKVTLRHNGHLYKIGIGRDHARARILMLIAQLDIRTINAATGEILRTLTLDTTRTCQPTGKPVGAPRKPRHPNP